MSVDLTRREFSLGAAAAAGAATKVFARSPHVTGAIHFSSSDKRLEEGFAWAKRQALQYVFTGDPVGPYYEASLPGRNAFCMRDVSHQATGAHLLGLADWNLNMLRKFAASISDSRDWCGYWEIDKWNRPAPVDYKNDSDFWYNLPANFDVLQCCWRQYQWTGNRAYLSDKVFLNFYDRTVDDYVRRWDKDGDGIMEGCKAPSHRGIASYNEEIEQPRTGADLVILQINAYWAYEQISIARHKYKEGAPVFMKAVSLRAAFGKAWWDPVEQRYYSERLQDGSYAHRSIQVFPVAGFPELQPPLGELDRAEAETNYNVEPASYLPERFYQYGRNQAAYRWLLWLTDPGLKRREYPEVSFAVVGAIVAGLMGIKPQPWGGVETFPRLTAQTAWATIERVPIQHREISLKHVGLKQTTLTNHSPKPLTWCATFPGDVQQFLINGKQAEPSPDPALSATPAHRIRHIRQSTSVYVTVPAGATRTVEVAT